MTDPTNEILDPLAVPAGSLEEPKYPILSQGVKTMKVVGFGETAAEDGSNKRLSIKLELTEKDKDINEETLHPGFVFTDSIFLTPKDGGTMQRIAEQSAMPVKAALGRRTTTSVRQCVNDPSLIIGKLVKVKIGVRKGKEEGQFFNNVKEYIVEGN